MADPTSNDPSHAATTDTHLGCTQPEEQSRQGGAAGHRVPDAAVDSGCLDGEQHVVLTHGRPLDLAEFSTSAEP